MDVWVCSIVEGYIYEKASNVDKKGYKEEYMERYRKKEREYRRWYPNGQLMVQSYYKEGKREGEIKGWWDENGQLKVYNIYIGGEVVEDLLFLQLY